MTGAYRVPVGGWRSDGRKRRVAAGSPNWWVILALSLALMALLVASAGTPHPSRSGRTLASAASDERRPAPRATGAGGAVRGAGDHSTARDSGHPPATKTPRTAQTGPTTTSTTGTPGASAADAALQRPPAVVAHPAATPAGSSGSTTPTAPTTPTTVATTTTTGAIAAHSIETPGYLDPPLQDSNSYAFTGAGATQIVVLWSGSTYLALSVTCPTGGQSVGGTSGMQATLADAGGSCTATVSEPSTEDVSLTYTITIGPPSG